MRGVVTFDPNIQEAQIYGGGVTCGVNRVQVLPHDENMSTAL